MKIGERGHMDEVVVILLGVTNCGDLDNAVIQGKSVSTLPENALKARSLSRQKAHRLMAGPR